MKKPTGKPFEITKNGVIHTKTPKYKTRDATFNPEIHEMVKTGKGTYKQVLKKTNL